MPSSENIASLHWASSNQKQPCYCTSPFELDVIKIVASRIAIGHIFAVPNPATIRIQDSDGREIECMNDVWKLEPQQDYHIHTTDPMKNVVCVKDTFSLFPGDTADEKSERMQKLSNVFYHKIWHGDKTPDDFRAKFVSRLSSSEIQAYRQFNWFIELFGGPSLYDAPGDGERFLKPKTMAKHPPSRMSIEYSTIWLTLMKETLEEVIPGEIELQKVLGTYWLHFFAAFPYSDEERKELEKLVA